MNYIITIIIALEFLFLFYTVIAHWRKLKTHWKTTAIGSLGLVLLLGICGHFVYLYHALPMDSYVFAILLGYGIGQLWSADAK